MNRRYVLALSVAATVALALGQRHLLAWIAGIDTASRFDDPRAPWAGNEAGDVTIVAYLDYNCPICKQTSRELHRFVDEDRGIRLVYKDWPVLGGTSIHGAQLALAAKYQGRYQSVHQALMALHGGSNSKVRIDAAVESTGVDMSRLQDDLRIHAAEISTILARNTVEAEALGLNGTPAYLIGQVRAYSLDRAGFERTVAEVRRHRLEAPAPPPRPGT